MKNCKIGDIGESNLRNELHLPSVRTIKSVIQVRVQLFQQQAERL
jgi:hypothetical protein